MENIKVKELLDAVNGKVLNGNIEDKYILSVATDSRQEMNNGLFVAIKGENTDGHRYIKDAVKNGAVVVLVSEKPKEFMTGIIYIKVQDTIKSLQDLASWYRLNFNIPVVAVTGSVGKTTTKDMIASVLKMKYNVLKTEGNFNSEIGTYFKNNIFDVLKDVFSINAKLKGVHDNA